MALILMEMTNSPKQLPFLMLVLVLAKQVSSRGEGGSLPLAHQPLM